MKKTLSVLALLGVISFSIPTAEAFCWSNLNPAYWGHCPRCEKTKNDCKCKKKCDPCESMTGGAANCNPCKKVKQKKNKCNPCQVQQELQKPCPCTPTPQPRNCDPCDNLQEMNN